MAINYEIVDDITHADIAFRAYGDTLNELFISAALAMLSVMLEHPDSVRPAVSRTIILEHAERDLLLYHFLQELIFYKDAEFLLLKPASVVIVEGTSCQLHGTLAGERINRERHAFSTDIKAVTMHRLSVERIGRKWQALVVLDV